MRKKSSSLRWFSLSSIPLLLLIVFTLLFQNCGPINSLRSMLGAGQDESSGRGSFEISSSQDSGDEDVDEWLKTPAFHSYYLPSKIIQEVHGTGVTTYNIDTNLFGDDVDITADAGYSYDIAVGAGLWTFSSARNAREPNDKLLDTMGKVLAINPNAQFILRVYAGVPNWFKHMIPGELEAYEDGCLYINSNKDAAGNCVEVTAKGPAAVSASYRQRVSLFSNAIPPYWSTGLAELKKALVARGYESKVKAMTLTGLHSQEWFHYDAHFFDDRNVRPMIYSRPHREAYQKWLAARFGTAKAGLTLPTEAEFRRTFFENAGGSAFYDLTNPVSWNVVHYSLFRSEETANVINRLAHEIKRYFPTTKVGAIYGYMNEWGGNAGYGHNALRILLNSNAIDFINPMPSYLDRTVGGADFERQPISSAKLHGKLVFNDIDFGTTASKQNYDSLCDDYKWVPAQCNGVGYLDAMLSMSYRINAGGTSFDPPNLAEDVHKFRRFLGFSLARDIHFSYLSLQNTTTAGQERSYLSDPSLLGAIIPQINRTKFNSRVYSHQSVSEILVVSDEDSNAFVRNFPRGPYYLDRSKDVTGVGDQSLYLSRLGLNKMGAPYDHILMSDLDLVDVKQYKLIIFLNAWKVNSQTKNVIDQKLKRDGKVLLWNYASGLFNENGEKSLTTVSNLVGINITNGLQIKAPSIELYGSSYPLFSFDHLSVSPPTVEGCCDMLYAADPGAHILGSFQGSNHVSMALKTFGNWKSIWTATAHLPPTVYRDIARFAGVHIYNRSDEPFYANQSFVTVVASATGPRTLFFPKPVTVYEALGDTLLASNVTSYTFSMSVGGVYIYRIATP